MPASCRASIATFQAFENAMSLDIAMGGSTNTVLHLLAAAHEAGVDFTMADIDKLSRKVPCLSKVAPAKSDVHMEDVHRAGGIMAILGELDRAGLLHTALPTVHSPTMGDALDDWDISRTDNPKVHEFYKAAPGGVPTQTAFSQSRRWDELDLDREKRRYPQRGTCLFAGWRAGCPLRQYRPRWLHREDRRRGRQHPEIHRSRARV